MTFEDEKESIDDLAKRVADMGIQPIYLWPTIALALVASAFTYRIVAKLIPIPVVRHVIGIIVARYAFYMWFGMIGVITIFVPVWRRFRRREGW